MSRSRSSPGNKIDLWEGGLSVEDREAFRSFCRLHQNKKGLILTYLIERGCSVHLSTVYKWIASNIPPGAMALALQEESKEYSGIDILSTMEHLLGKVVLVSNLLVDQVHQDRESLTTQQAIAALPALIRQTLSAAEFLQKSQFQIDFELFTMTGATRLAELVLNSPSVKDKPEEALIKRVLEYALITVKEEIDKGVVN